MRKLTLDEAIKHCLEVAEQNETQAEKWRKEGGEQWGKATACRECAADHRQLAEWLTELKEAKRLLKLAVDDFEMGMTTGFMCNLCKFALGHCTGCTWRYADEALKLIGDESNGI